MLSDIFSNNKFFTDNPLKVCGEEYKTTSMFFPLMVKGTKAKVINTIRQKNKKGMSGTLASDKDDFFSFIKPSQFAPDLKGLGQLAFTPSEIIKKYNKNLTDEEIKVWVWYKRKNNISEMNMFEDYWSSPTSTQIHKWLENGLLFIDSADDPYNSRLVPKVIFLFNNLFDKKREIERVKDLIISKYNQKVYEIHIKTLEDNFPKTQSFMDIDDNKRPKLLPISNFVRDTKIEIREDDKFDEVLEGISAPYYIEKMNDMSYQNVSLYDRYVSFLDGLAKDFERENGVSGSAIISYYLENARKPRFYTKEEFEKLKGKAREFGDSLLDMFVHKILPAREQKRLDVLFNEIYNGIPDVDYSKVPISFSCSKTFLGKSFAMRDVQREALGFMELTGSGILAYDVGLGKTVTAIVETISSIQNGKCNKPLIVVPKGTYKNWKKEIASLIAGTDIKLVEWENLGVGVEMKTSDRSIHLCTYQAVTKLAINLENNFDFLSEMESNITQGSDGEKLTPRNQNLKEEKFQSELGKFMYDTEYDIDEIGIDYLVIDEAHNFKKVFGEVKVDGEDNKKHFQITAGQPSLRGIKAFFLCNYIQRQFGRNVLLLTATPFTNSPLEIYSMMSLVAREYMKKYKINNISDFFRTFIVETVERVITQKETFEYKSIIKGFNMMITLKNMIFSHMLLKDGSLDVIPPIPRPVKLNIPFFNKVKGENINSVLHMSTTQKRIQDDLNEEANQPITKDDMSKMLRLLGMSQNNALSPALVGGVQNMISEFRLDFPKSDFLTDDEIIIENSPKIHYAMECIGSVVNYHINNNTQITGQVIYMDRGKELMPYIKAYLNRVVGFKNGVKYERGKVDEVEFITGDVNEDKRYKIANAFNEGVCKVVIGTSAIKEGLNLQENSTVLYNLYPNWNPTDFKQIEGRIHRYKNKNGFVRVVMPLIENSSDVFVFQKLQEKQTRINAILSKNNDYNYLSEDALNPEEVKMALITNIDLLVNEEVKKRFGGLDKDIWRLAEEKVTLKELIPKKESLNIARNMLLDNATKLNKALEVSKRELRQQDLDNINDFFVKKDDDYILLLTIANLLSREIRISLPNPDDLEDIIPYNTTELRKDIKQIAMATKKYENNNLVEVVNMVHKEMEEKTVVLKQFKKDEIDYKKMGGGSEDNALFKIRREIEETKKRLKIEGLDVDEAVDVFNEFNHLLDYKFTDIDHEKSTPFKIVKYEGVKPTGGQSKDRKLAIAKAKAKALKLKLILLK